MGWIAEPKAAEVPTIPPGGFIEMGIKIHPTGLYQRISYSQEGVYCYRLSS